MPSLKLTKPSPKRRPAISISFKGKQYKAGPFRQGLRVVIPLPDGTRRQLLGSSASELQARATELETQTNPETFGNYFAGPYATSRRGADVDPDTLRHEANAFGSYILPMFGNVVMRDLTRDMAQQAFNYWREHPAEPKPRKDGSRRTRRVERLSSGTLDLIKRKWTQLINLAIEDGLMERNPLKKVKVGDVPEGRPSRIDAPDVLAMLSAPAPGVRNLGRLLALGMHLQECLGARRVDVTYVRNPRRPDLPGVDAITVVHQREYQALADLKEPHRRRTIPLPSGWAEAILADAGEMMLVMGDAGTPMPRCDVWEAIVATCGPNKSSHDFRRYFASTLENVIEAPRPAVNALLGHKGKSGDMTDRYSWGHVLQYRKHVQAYIDFVLSDGTQQIVYNQRETGSN